jgi:hypothetical protein
MTPVGVIRETDGCWLSNLVLVHPLPREGA